MSSACVHQTRWVKSGAPVRCPVIGGGRGNQRWDFLPEFDTKVVLNVILGVKITLFEVMVYGLGV